MSPTGLPPPAWDRALRAPPRLEDLFAFAFAAALARQALWLLPGTAVPVALSVVAGLAAAAVARRSAHERPSPPRLFWLAVALPVLAFWGLRAPLADLGYDVLNYHLMHGERGLWGPVLPPGDFYPLSFPHQNPAPDIVTALFRGALGYRLGTIASPLALVWAAEVLWRLLAPAVRDVRLRVGAVLLAIAAEGMLWEVSGYMVDLLALPVLLEATRVAAAADRPPGQLPRRAALLGLLLGTAVALKLTNFVFVPPLGLVALVRWLGPRADRPGAGTVLGACAAGTAAFALPVAPHALLVLATTGSPVFPYFNAFFRSPFFPVWNIKDVRFGPESTAQALVWPLLSAFRPERFSEFAFTTGRFALGWCAALVVLARPPREGLARAAAAIVVLGGLLWSLGTGNHRYGLFLELLGGLLLVLLAARLAGLGTPGGTDPAPSAVGRLERGAAAALLIVAAAQSAGAVARTVLSDWSGRPTVFSPAAKPAREALLFLRDRRLPSFLSPGQREAIPPDPVWVDVVPRVNGFMALLDRDAPMIGLQVRDFLAAPANLELLDRALAASRGRRALSLAFAEDAAAAEAALTRLGFPVRRRSPLPLAFFSRVRRIDLVLFEVDLPPPLGVDPGPDVPTPWKTDVSLRGSMDGPATGEEVRGDLVVRGWAREPGEDLVVTVLVGGVEQVPRSFRRLPRPDVAAAIPEMGDCGAAGYEAVVGRPASLPPEVEVSVLFRSRTGRTRHYPGVRIRWKEPAAAGGSPGD